MTQIRIDDAKLQQIIGSLDTVSDDLIGVIGEEGLRIVRQSFNTSPAGHTYKRGTIIHIASQPGYPPNIDTGKLSGGMNVTRPARLQRSINTGDTEYALPLEFGSVKAAARPYMRPMALRLEAEIPDLAQGFLENT